MSDLYKLASTDRVKELELELHKELQELKNEIEENDMVHGISARTVSSVLLPKDVDHYRRERQVVFDRAMEVAEAAPLQIQAEVMREEMENTEQWEYTTKSLPLLLHQYFVDRIGQLVQCKHMHMLRWKRFCEHTNTIESLFPIYQKRLALIMAEYNDCLQRAQRLAASRESLLADNDSSVHLLKVEDLTIYLRWLISHLHSVKHFQRYVRVLQWFPVIHKHEILPDPKESHEEEYSNLTKIPSKYQDEDKYSLLSALGSSRTQQEAKPRPGSAIPPAPPPVDPVLLSTTPLPASASIHTAAAAGGGLSSNESTLGLPLHVNDVESLQPHLSLFTNLYSLGVSSGTISSTADEMELFAAVNRKFKQLFSRQEHLRTYKTYERIEPGQENWGADHSMHALKQESNWLPFIKLKPESDAHQNKWMTQLRLKNKIDTLLQVQSKFMKIGDPDKIQEALRQHAVSVRDPPATQAVSVTSNRTRAHTGAIWKKIYSNPELYAKSESEENGDVEEFDEKDTDNVSFGGRAGAVSARKRRDSYDYFDAVQMLGLDDGEQDNDDPASIQGAYLSFLHLRHLRIRDLQRTVLGLLNYFRSVERTLTINDGGLSLESGKPRSGSRFRKAAESVRTMLNCFSKIPQNHRKSNSDLGGLGGGGGIGSHHYMHNTPMDFKLNEVEFMEFSDIENHDDFYSIDEGRVHVQDQRGYYVMYDAAINDYEALEADLLLIATHYIEKDRDLRGVSAIQRSTSARKKQQSAGDFDLPSYGHQEVDRFGVLLDLWSNEAGFLESKKHLLDCYLEAYHHVFDRDERRNLAQVITNVMHKRPRYDFTSPYFVKGYRMESVNFRLHAQLVKDILNNQIEEQREYIQKVCREGDGAFGLPHRIIPKQPISVNMSRSALKNVYMLEFHPSLAVISQLPGVLRYVYMELFHLHKPESVLEQLTMEKKLLERAHKDWKVLPPIGASFSPQVQRDLFSDVFVEDPTFVADIAGTVVAKADEKAARQSKKERHVIAIKTMARLLETVTLRHRLLDAAWETEVLSKVYKMQAVEMGFDECHLFLRFVQFEFASYKESAGKPPPIFITAVQEDDSSVDRYTPSSLYLAIHELDENHVGRVSFRSKEGITAVVHTGGVETLQVIVKMQVVHKNALVSAVQQAHVCEPLKESVFDVKSGRHGDKSETDTKSELSSMTALTSLTGGTGASAMAQKFTSHLGKTKRSPEAFVSLQLEKTPSRDLMLNEFVNKKNTMGSILKNAEEMQKLKRRLVSDYCSTLNLRISQYSLRGQIIAYYNSILGLLEEFPNIRDTYFIMGEPNEKKTDQDTLQGLTPDPRMLRKRPRRLLSADGQHLLNIWFIPHHSEILIMFKTLDDLACRQALLVSLQIVSALHDIMQYLCAHARMGSSHARLGSHKMEFVSADWGGTEGIGADLREMQKQMQNLEDPLQPAGVAEFLRGRRDIMFLEFDVAVRHSMRDMFLAAGNMQAFHSIQDCMHTGLSGLCNIPNPSALSTYLNVPEPLEPRDVRARDLYPYRAFLGRMGPVPVMLWQCQQIQYNMQLCLSGLKDVDKHVAHGEILGVSLLMEDVLQSGYQRVSMETGETEEEEEEDKKSERGSSGLSRHSASLGQRSARSRPQSSSSVKGQQIQSVLPVKHPVSRNKQPIEAYKLLRMFLLLWKRLEVFKNDWGRRKLDVEKIDRYSTYKDFCIEYKKEILFPVLQGVARRYGHGELYEGMVSDLEPLSIPKGASEMEVRYRQLVRLCEGLECYMISEVRKKLAKELTLVLSERAREEGTLPTDLWKKPAIKESFTMARPHVAEDFTELLMSDVREEDGVITIRKEHLNTCLSRLAGAVMLRERQNYDSYSMFYENLLRQHHQLLHQREQENKQLRDQLKYAQANTDIQVQCQLADESFDLILEITALRAKVAEMREISLTQERDIRERVREEYDALVQNLFSSSFELKRKFDEFREDLYDDVYEKITESRREALEAILKLKQKRGPIKITDDMTSRNIAKSQQLRQLQTDNHDLHVLMMKMKTFNQWKHTNSLSDYSKEVSELKRLASRSKKDYLEIKMLAEEEVILLRQQLVALRKALAQSEQLCKETKKTLEKETKDNKEKSHAALQKARSQKQLEAARQANIEKLYTELDDKEQRLQLLSEAKEKNSKMQQLIQEKAEKDCAIYRKQLNHERNLKLDAFQRVGELQTAIHEPEPVLSMPRPHTSHLPTSSRSKTRAVSPIKKSRSTERISSVWPQPISWPANYLTPDPLAALSSSSNNNTISHDSKKIQRPKTVPGRLRTQIADRLLNDLDPPDHHQTLVRLRELRLLETKN